MDFVVLRIDLLGHGIRAHIAWFMLTLYGISMILAGVFQDSPGANNAPLNTEGIFHNAVIITSCLSMLFGMWMFAGSVYKKPSWFGFTWFTIVASFMGMILSIIFAVQSHVPFAGLTTTVLLLCNTHLDRNDFYMAFSVIIQAVNTCYFWYLKSVTSF